MKKISRLFTIGMVVAALVSFTSVRPATAQDATGASNDPWSICNYHSYSQPFPSGQCDQQEDSAQVNYAPAAPPPQQAYQTPVPNTDIRTQLHTLLRQHVTGGSDAFMARYDQNPTYPQLQQAVDQNTQALSQLIGSINNPQAQSDFYQAWQNHINLLGQYVDETKNGDQAGKRQTMQQLNKFADGMAAFFQNQQYSKQRFLSVLQSHVNDETSIIDNYGGGGNRAAIPNLINQDLQHADMLADMILGITYGQATSPYPTYVPQPTYSPPAPTYSPPPSRSGEDENPADSPNDGDE